MTPYARKFALSLTASLLLAVFSASANASYIGWSWSDFYDPNPDLLVPPAHTYTHDISDGADGFRPGIDKLTWFQLTLDLYSTEELGGAAFIDVPTYLQIEDPWLEFGDNWFWDLSGTEFGGWSLAGWLSLLSTGEYTVTVSSAAGDFLFGSSRLDAGGFREVPEPGTLALLAIGLIGMGVALAWARRRSRSRNNNKH